MRDGVFWGVLDDLDCLDFLEIFPPANIQKNTNPHVAKLKEKDRYLRKM
jgi:hypothetical protein